jgi:hypothetical protein
MAPATEGGEGKMQNSYFSQVLYIQSREQVSLVTMPYPSLRTVAPPPCLPLCIKDSLKEDYGGLMTEGLMGLDWWAACNNAAAAAGCCVSASLRTKTLRENMGQCKSEGQEFKRD